VLHRQVIQKVSSDGLLRKNKNILQTMNNAIWCAYCTLLFDTVSSIPEALVIALHQLSYPFIVEWCCLLCKACGNSFFDLIVFVEPPASKEGLRCNNKWKSLGAKCGPHGGWWSCSQRNVMMRFCIAVCGWVLSWIITTPRLNMKDSL